MRRNRGFFGTKFIYHPKNENVNSNVIAEAIIDGMNTIYPIYFFDSKTEEVYSHAHGIERKVIGSITTLPYESKMAYKVLLSRPLSDLELNSGKMDMLIEQYSKSRIE